VAELSAAPAAPRARWSRGWFAVGAAASIVAASTAWSWIRFARGSLQGSDFFSFYAAARLFLRDGGRHLYDANLQLHYQNQVTSGWPGSFSLLPYIHPPFYTVLIAPLGTLDFHAAYLVAAVANLFLVGAAVLVLSRANRWDRTMAFLAAAVTMAFLPVWVVVLQGQSDFLILLALSLAYYFWTRERTGWAGFFAGLALLKPQMVLVLPLLFLARRSWRAIIGFGTAVLGLVVASLAVFDLGVWADYVRVVGPWASGGPNAFPITRQTASSLRGLLEVAPGGRPVALLTLAIFLVLVFATLGWKARGSTLDLGFAMAASVVLSPYLNFHDLALLVVPGFALAALARSGELVRPRLGWSVMAFSYLAIEFSTRIGLYWSAIGAIALTLYLASERLSIGPEPLALGDITWSGPKPRRVVVLPAYRAEKTVRDVVAQIPRAEVDRILLVDDAGSDRTAEVALELGIDVIRHPRNLGYGGNQKTCYANALLMGAEVVVMLHPDGQYDPRLVPQLCQAIEAGRGDVALGSRWLNLDPAKSGMPWWKRIGNRFLTAAENQVLGLGLSEYHTGYRAYSRRFLETVPYADNADDFVFDTQILVQAANFGFKIAEIPAEGRYFEDMSSIGMKTSIVYGLKTLAALVAYLGHRAGLPCRWLTPRGSAARPT
jgi:hypothetical protein